MPLIKRRTKKPAVKNNPDNQTSRIDQNVLSATIEDALRLQSFALILEGDALAPHYLDGDLLTICPHAEPAPGDCVLALVRGEYVCMRINADGDLWANHSEFIPRGFYTVAGVVLDRTPRNA